MRRTASRALAACLTVILVAGCTTYTLVEPKRTEMGGFYTVNPQIAWSEWKEDDLRLWTVDGFGLESLRFYLGLADGGTLFEPEGDEELPKFDPGMRANEVVEFVVDSFARRGANGIESSGLRPAGFGSRSGYRFEFQFQTNSGLNVDGMALGAVIDDRLHLIVFTAASTYYFGKYRGRVEDLFESIQMI